VKLQAVDPGFGLDLVLEAQKPLALHGDQGLSAKSDLPGNASYYLSYTRMQAAGRVRVGDTTFVVEGTSWFDHEWSTSALETADVGWDWFGLQLGDGRDLMLYWIRRADGSFEPVSGGTLIQPDGSTIPLSMGEVLISVESTWTSPHSGAEYPGAWRIDLPAYDLVLSIEPLVQDQELQLSFTYWEGAVRISGMSAGSIVEGMGYIELTGYDASMGGVLSRIFIWGNGPGGKKEAPPDLRGTSPGAVATLASGHVTTVALYVPRGQKFHSSLVT
jgi:predicted secreted hydrolase